MKKRFKLETDDYKYKSMKAEKMYISKELVKSKAWLSLKTAATCQVYLLFLTKCVIEKSTLSAKHRKNVWVITNNGEIQFSYKEALDKYDLKAGRFKGAIDALVEAGFIDIEHSGFGLQKDVSRYAISDRWKAYGTDDFIKAERQKRQCQLGFTKGNQLGRNSMKIKSTSMNEHCSAVANTC